MRFEEAWGRKLRKERWRRRVSRSTTNMGARVCVSLWCVRECTQVLALSVRQKEELERRQPCQIAQPTQPNLNRVGERN